MMKSIDELVSDYRSHHKKLSTRLTHIYAIPMLVLSILIFFSWIRIDFATHLQIDVAWLIALGIVIYYIYLHVGLGILMAFILALFCWLADWIAGPKPDLTSIIIFILLFVPSVLTIQIGHAHEKNRVCGPKNLHHCSIALLMLVADILGYLGVRRFKP